MKKMLFGTMLLALVIVIPLQTMGQVGISVNIGLPPPIAFAAPPDVIVLPDTDDVYVVPDLDIDLFFWRGWWWRLWEDRWYRSTYYDQGWDYYSYVPTFYYDVDPWWRGYYRDRNWYGYRWDHERISHQRLQRNWSSWHHDRYWERRGQAWGVQNYRPRPERQRQELRQQREWQYQQRPETRQFQQRQGPQRQPQVRQPRQQFQERVQPQRQEQRSQERVQQPQRSRSQGKPEGRGEEHIK